MERTVMRAAATIAVLAAVGPLPLCEGMRHPTDAGTRRDRGPRARGLDGAGDAPQSSVSVK
ncbi:MAG TPA: hypothetical protein VGR24_00890 [bacterium]|nr:hypothetical protein [bacterium]